MIVMRKLFTMIFMTLDITAQGRKRHEIIETLRQISRPVKTLPGCRGCRICQDINTKNILTYVEEWETESDLEHRIRSDQFRKVLEVMEFSSAPPELRFLTVTQNIGLETVEMIRGLGPVPLILKRKGG